MFLKSEMAFITIILQKLTLIAIPKIYGIISYK
jgi:hypothetical protein